MPQFVIPDSVKPITQYLASLPPQKRSEINEIMIAMPPNSDSTDIAIRLSEAFNLDPENAFALVQQFYMWIFQNAQKYGLEKVLTDFRQAAENEYPGDWKAFFDGLKRVIESEPLKTAYLFARAENIQSAADHAFLTANMVTTLVPFQVSDTRLSAAISHELRITYAHGPRQDFFVITLSEKDIEFLQLVLNKAQEFGGSITNFVKERQLSLLTHSEK
jgi:hypothetical protein